MRIALLSHRVKYVDVFTSHRIADSNWDRDRVSQLRIAARFLDFVALSVLLNSLATATTTATRRSTTKSRTLYKAVNKMCISLNSLSERRLADGSVRWPALHIWRPIKMHFAKKFLPLPLSLYVFPLIGCIRLKLFKLQFCLPDL